MDLNQTPSSDRLHIGVYGKRNSGKSSLLNAMTNQKVAVVSSVAGTTTDPVYKAMEVRGLGACVFIDTAGFDDEGELGELRLEKTKLAMEKTDVAILVFSDTDIDLEELWFNRLVAQGTPVVAVINKSDLLTYVGHLSEKIINTLKIEPIVVSALNNSGIDDLLTALARTVPASYHQSSITSHLVASGDTVMLVMPQDEAAPKGRLILPQVQTIRDLLDNNCVIISTTPAMLDAALDSLSEPPNLIITDSQAFFEVYNKKPEASRLTSFSILFAAHKGDIDLFIAGANHVDELSGSSHVLIAEACTHAPVGEDIGRVKIPQMLKSRYGEGIQIDIVSGTDFPADLTPYDLVVHCGGCMFNKKHLMTRIDRARDAGIPITNYGVLIAKLTGILDKIVT